MENESRRQLEKLERALAEFEKSARTDLGFVGTIEYRGISFHVSRRFVTADLAPLAFLHLLEHIIGDDARDAVVNLYERLNPLLSCRHQWTSLKRFSDEAVLKLCATNVHGAPAPQVCKLCTAYALSREIPVVGRSIAPDASP